MLTVHHLENSRSHRIIWLLEELKLPYEIKKYHRNSKTMLGPKELKQVSPLGKVPVIVDDTEDGQLTLAESGAIVEYIVDRYGNDTMKPRARFAKDGMSYSYYMHYAEGTLMPYLTQLLLFTLLPGRFPFFFRWLVALISKQVIRLFLLPNICSQLDALEEDLEGKTWFCGDKISGADIMMSLPVEAALLREDYGKRKNLRRFISQIKERDAWKQAEEKGGKLDLGVLG